MESLVDDSRRVPPLPGELACLSEPEKSLSLSHCLSVFTDGLKEEQTWAVTYQTIKEFKKNYRLDINLSDNKKPLRCCENLDQLMITSHGRCYINDSAKIATDTSEAISSLGDVMYKSLDYGLSKDQERDLSGSLENLIGEMALAGEEITEDSSQSQERIDAGDDEEESCVNEEIADSIGYFLGIFSYFCFSL